ncbi:unnamed protein product [Caenorhabditis sp. 36 PRJEB53466]|nr:unnamed protein product [Caenorhabditis sp. 36 PRJEB53466]
MEPINGNPTSVASVEPLSLAAADQVGGAFCHQFYITVSENRKLITKFYGHESIFHYDDQTVTGATEISKLYDSLPESTHFKIHSIKGFPTLHNQGVKIQAVGTVNLRPFVQTFVLGQQGQKKYYVEIDSFQYLDNFFEFKSEQEKSPTPTTASNGHSNGVNGKVTKKQEHPAEPHPTKPTPQKLHQTPKKAEEPPRQVKQETPKSMEKEIQKSPKPPVVQKPQQQQQAPAPAPAPIPEPVQEQPKAPRTWATLVGGGKQQPPMQQNYGQGPQFAQQQLNHHMQQQAALHQHAAHQLYQHQQAQQQQRAQAQAQAQQAPQQQPPVDLHQQGGDQENINLNERKIYLGGITREIVPSNTAQAETEIKQVFYKYGEVEEVRMPRKVLDSPNDTSKHAFAFITMRNKSGVQAIFGDAKRDETGVWKLPLKLDAFGFDGLAQISEQRDPPNGGFRGGRGGGGFNRGGGQFFRRGGSGGVPRGGLRGFHSTPLNGH